MTGPEVFWDRYAFGVYEVAPAGQGGVGWPEIPGLYVFAHWGSNQRWDPLYIGQTHSFADRLPNHEKWPAALRLGSSHVHLREEHNAWARESLERFLIQQFRPPLNELLG